MQGYSCQVAASEVALGVQCSMGGECSAVQGRILCTGGAGCGDVSAGGARGRRQCSDGSGWW